MRPPAGQVLHFSEDPHITRFAPPGSLSPYVWALNAEQAPAYWFPRDCPRVLAWPGPRTTVADRGLLQDHRVHAIEYGWLGRLRTVLLYAYRFDARPFRPLGTPDPYAMVATEAVQPLGPPEPVGDLLALHERAGIELRLLPSLWKLHDLVAASSLQFSCIRMRNADASA
ncbi:hypothetical protein Asp14428_50330 [Actinoplanes sp. NBRC 14428]|uniref:Uncharacterized protein n=1 Tax=Pseudosporangium ferrugineum TaxID=439699 RepID=A0A2T0S6D6_9ACTN|nr:DUF6886 family protein [Pseudosporangium ferrugineum]PRY28976.1 hypothetical protein CLV70_107284 [Pseudosporangium ferrugineum]BCJ53558.1 hypothetical protein Asp14428_50330 [Actinoplanes sp. NBRC 14428]